MGNLKLEIIKEIISMCRYHDFLVALVGTFWDLLPMLPDIASLPLGCPLHDIFGCTGYRLHEWAHGVHLREILAPLHDAARAIGLPHHLPHLPYIPSWRQWESAFTMIYREVTDLAAQHWETLSEDFIAAAWIFTGQVALAAV